MKSLVLKFSIIAILFSGIVCNSTHGKERKTTNKFLNQVKVEIYYFHYTRRCVTCMAVENVTKEALEEIYTSQLKNEDIVFKTINLDEADSEEIAEKLNVSGQTLLIVAGDKKENITTDAFLNARSHPDKLKDILKSKIDPLLEK
ncbi:MAG: hypothetical protein C0597_11090 [Marinilabiliales bacterium]|nr:MAG: hypothetical protein C0597_11090 [Marinilabiliales bacterium]